MMKSATIKFITIVFLSLSNKGFADLGIINLKLQATIVATGCSVSIDSKDKTVDMGRLATKQIKNNGGKGPLIPFTLNLSDCTGTVSTVKIKFTGTSDVTDNSLLAISGTNHAQNIAISILDKDRQKIPLGLPNSNYQTTKDIDDYTMSFYAQYVATGKNVIAGEANSMANFTIEYL